MRTKAYINWVLCMIGAHVLGTFWYTDTGLNRKHVILCEHCRKRLPNEINEKPL